MKDKDILESWKEIADYLGQTVRTCYRWERELGLPVHRIDKDSMRSKVFAYKSEIDQWLKEKSAQEKISRKSIFENRRFVIGLISGLLAISVLFVFLYIKSWRISSPLSKKITIVVYTFENSGDVKADDHFSTGISKLIINDLEKIKELRIVSGESDSQIRSADYVLTGKVMTDGERTSLQVQLSQNTDGKILWNEKYEDRLENIFDLEKDIVLKILEATQLNTEENLSLLLDEDSRIFQSLDSYLQKVYLPKRLDEETLDPWKLYHEGKIFKDMGLKESNELAINLFFQAIKNDVNFVPAYVGIAQCYVNYVKYYWDFDLSWLDKAEELIKREQDIYTDYPDCLNTLIEIYLLKYMRFNLDTKAMAYELAEEGMKRYPEDPDMNSIVGDCYCLRYGEKGDEADFRKALNYKEKGFWLNPYSLNNLEYIRLLMLNKEFDKAINICNVIMNRSSSLLISFHLGEIYYYKGELEKSVSIFKDLETSMDFKAGALLYLGMIEAQRGDPKTTADILQKIELLLPKEHKLFLNQLWLSSIYMGFGRKKSGYAHLQAFFDSEHIRRTPFLFIKYIEIDGNFRDSVNDKEFKEITSSFHALR